jgi:hypothetical protein
VSKKTKKKQTNKQTNETKKTHLALDGAFEKLENLVEHFIHARELWLANACVFFELEMNEQSNPLARET